MATIYVGTVAAGLADGTSWDNRYGSLTAAEDQPVVAGDDVIIGPGVYREKLTIDVSGGAGTPITYIGDITGQATDGVGGVVRVTGSDDDLVALRDHCVEATSKDYRTFRGIQSDLTTDDVWHTALGCNNWIVEDCCFLDGGDQLICIVGTSNDWLIQRCFFMGPLAGANGCLYFSDAGAHTSNHEVKNCLFLIGSGSRYGIYTSYIDTIDIRNCTFLYGHAAITVSLNTPDNTIIVENCIFAYNYLAIQSVFANKVVEDYNTFWSNSTDRTNVAVGANSEVYPPLFTAPLLHSGTGQISGYKYPWWSGMLSNWSGIRAIAGNAPEDYDMLGIPRPPNNAQRSWGALQYADMERETGTVRAGVASLALHDAGRWQMWVPVTAVATTVSVRVYREANYAGNLPQMVIKQPGQADRITTDISAAGMWNLLTDTFTPAASPPYVVVELVSRNTAVALAFETFFDNLLVS